MNKLPAILFAVVLALAALVALWLVLDESPQRGAVAQPAAEAPAPVPTLEDRPLAAPEVVPVAEVASPAPASPVADEPAHSERSQVEATGDDRTIVGRVHIPPGAPEDPTLRVIALPKSATTEDVYGDGELLAKLADGQRDLVLGSAEVRPDSTFALRLPEGTVSAYLAVDGRFLYSPHCEPARAGDPPIALATELGACLAGLVRLPDDVPDRAKAFEALDVELELDSADFSLGQAQSEPLFDRGAKVDAEGRFEVRAVSTGSNRQLSVQSDDHADWKQAGLDFEPGKVREVEVALHEGATLRGRVTDEGGRPVADAEVRAAESAFWGFAGETLAETKTAADGTFVLEHVAAGKAIALAECDGFLESEPERIELRDGEDRAGIALALSRGASVSGRVAFPDGSAASAATIEVGFDPAALAGMAAMNAARGAEGQAKAGEDGRFEVPGLGKGPFVVEAELEREVGGEKATWRAKATGVTSGATGVELVLAAPCILAGKVMDATGAPVTRFHVRVTAPSAMVYIPSESKEEEFHGEDGAFALRELDAGPWQVRARAEGFGPMEPVEIVLPQATAGPLVLTLAPAASAAGTVLDPDGDPVPGARVTLHADMGQSIQRLAGRLDLPETVSGADGTFVLTGLGAKSSSLVATAQGFAPSEPVPFEGRPGEQVGGLVLRLRHGATVTGEVYDAEGERAAGVRVIARNGSSMAMSSAQADGQGLFRFEHLEPGGWTITALLNAADTVAEDDSSAEEVSANFMDNIRFTMVELAENGEQHVVLGAPPKDPVVVRGRITHGKEPLPRGLVSFMGEGAKGFEALKITSVGSDGHYEAELAEPGRYAISVQVQAEGAVFAQQNIEFHETIPEAEEHTLDLELPLGGVRGSVRGPDREPCSGARVSLGVEGGIEAGSMLGGNFSEATTDANGEYAFEFLRPGTYTIAAGGAVLGGAFGGEGKGGRVLHPGVRVEEGRIVEGVDFELEEPGSLDGKVVDASGAPVQEATIFVRDGNGRVLDRFSFTSSGSDGAFRYTGLAPGEYQVSARKGALASPESAPVKVRSGEKTTVQVSLQPGTKLQIEILDGEGEHAEARLSVVDPQGREVHGMIGMSEIAASISDGLSSEVFTIGPLPPGTYTVTAVAPDGQKTSKPVVLDGQPERRLKLRLK